MRKNKKTDYKSIIKDKKLPILTLDSRWHNIFPDERKTVKIKLLEQRVNQLLQEQGKMVHDIKDMRKLKKKLLSDIIVNMDIKDDMIGKSKEKKLDQNKRFVDELNGKIDKASDRLSELPYRIKKANEELLAESVKNCYERLHDNQKQLNITSDWIRKTREELKKKILTKHDIETTNNLIYSYMHDVLGAEVIDGFDLTNEINKNDSNSPD